MAGDSVAERNFFIYIQATVNCIIYVPEFRPFDKRSHSSRIECGQTIPSVSQAPAGRRHILVGAGH